MSVFVVVVVNIAAVVVGGYSRIAMGVAWAKEGHDAAGQYVYYLNNIFS